MGPSLRIVREENGGSQGRIRPPSGKATKAALILFGCIALTEANGLLNDEAAWTWYLTMSEVTKAALCSFLRPHWLKWTGTGFFLSQALDEFVGGNLFAEGHWECGLLALFALTTYILMRNERD